MPDWRLPRVSASIVRSCEPPDSAVVVCRVASLMGITQFTLKYGAGSTLISIDVHFLYTGLALEVAP